MFELHLTTPSAWYIVAFYVAFLFLLAQSIFLLLKSGGVSRGQRALFSVVIACLVVAGTWMVLQLRTQFISSASVPLSAGAHPTTAIIASRPTPTTTQIYQIPAGTAAAPTEKPTVRITEGAVASSTATPVPNGGVVIQPKLPLAGSFDITLLSGGVGILTLLVGLAL